jgi:hypothetical protein
MAGGLNLTRSEIMQMTMFEAEDTLDRLTECRRREARAFKGKR